MRHILNNVGGLLGVLALGVLVIVLALTFGGLQGGLGAEDLRAFQALKGTLTQPPYPPPSTPVRLSTPQPTSAGLPYPPPGTPVPQPTLRPTSTRPPAPPTSTATPTFTPAPPTATPAPLPSLVPGLQTFIYATTGERYPEIYRVQVDLASRTVKSIHLVHTAELWYSRTHLEGLYPSPDGRRVAVAWVYGEGGHFVSILDVNDGMFTPLLGEGARVDQGATSLDWSPDGTKVLILGLGTNPDLHDSAWLVDVSTHVYSEVDIKQTTDLQRVTSASFSPDGKTIVYARTNGYKCGSEIWRTALDGTERQLLFEVSEFRVEDVLWSPDGCCIAFTQWRESEAHDFYMGGLHTVFAIGELWVMNAEGSGRRLLASTLTGYNRRFVPVWSPNGQQIAFVQGSGSGGELNKLSSNGYIVDIQSGNIAQLTSFQSAQVLNPAWSSSGTQVVFAVRQDTSSEQFEPWVAAVDAHDICRLDGSTALVMDGRKSNPVIVWLPIPPFRR